MLLRTKGTPNRTSENAQVGRVTRDINALDSTTFFLAENSEVPQSNDFLGVLATSKNIISENTTVFNVPNFEHLENGDIVAVHQDGGISTLYRVNSYHNTLLATERCNSNCLMCSQPPKDKNDIHYMFEMHKQLIPLIPKDCVELVISGGEPTLLGDLFFETLRLCKENLPDTEIHVLTNGRSFAWQNMAERLAELDYQRLMLGVPVYSDYYQVHDYVVQAENAFYQTITGLHNLATYGQRVEIRVVLQKAVIPRLTKLAKYIFKNLPFAEHVTFMGLEYTGYTPHNINKLWIDPYDYQNELSEAVEYLAMNGMNVSIYNIQW
jgi:His-Xaa-Ser system radical SAM maturase HxsC